METAKEMSGRVLVAAYMSDPIARWYGTARMSSAWVTSSSGVSVSVALESIGVGAGLASSILKRSRTMLTYASWDNMMVHVARFRSTFSPSNHLSLLVLV